MFWTTRQLVGVDRVACPWLIKKFIDHQKLVWGFPGYDALYAYCKKKVVA
ncbi:MAG: chromate resistance protein [Acidobacteriota bacterium]